MRVSLLYNRNAGEGLPLDHIRDAMTRHGHQLVRVVEKHTDVDRLLEDRTDLVAAAGGDGTIALAARIMARRGIPLAILPIGTANNIAKSLGLEGSMDQLIDKWDLARSQPLDLGVADGAWGRRYFVEAVGGGLIPTGIAEMQTRSDGDEHPSATKVEGAVRTFREVLSRLQPDHWTIDLDGIEATGDFLLVEVLNIRSIGPNLVFSADANPSDGSFRVVVAGEEDRDELVRYLQCRLEQREYPLSLVSRRARHVTLRGPTDVHVDDEVLSGSGNGAVSIHLETGVLQVLA